MNGKTILRSKAAMASCFLALSVCLYVGCMPIGAVIGIGTSIVDNSPEISAKLDARWVDYFENHPKKIVEYNELSRDILAQFDSPPDSTVGASITLVGMAVNVDKLGTIGKKALKAFKSYVEPIINSRILKYGIQDQGQVADLVGRVLKRINRVTGQMLE